MLWKTFLKSFPAADFWLHGHTGGRETRHQRPSLGIQAPSSSWGSTSTLPPPPPGNFAAVPPSCAFAALSVCYPNKVSLLCHKVVT
ncbi:hypothetical protein DV515_00007486 [Chloebia gouldiae]|uniref:Uncharacterized protein n=1 Tax=Chloebia gouldiae TaxID=44316 RepID=A0A3L8SHJ0_CHLGU|nr:hypothetical protein DV515_00007486 [Chloebia gouldiae]